MNLPLGRWKDAVSETSNAYELETFEPAAPVKVEETRIAGVYPEHHAAWAAGMKTGSPCRRGQACYFGIVVVEKGRGKRGPKQLHVRRLILFWSPATIGPRRLLPVSCIL